MQSVSSADTRGALLRDRHCPHNTLGSLQPRSRRSAPTGAGARPCRTTQLYRVVIVLRPTNHQTELTVTESMQTTAEQYDLVVLGSGEAGKYSAWTSAKEGMRAVVIERKYVGGSCPNIACLPSKNIIHSAKVASYFWRSGEFGITKDNTQINMSAVRDRKRKMVHGLVDMHLANFKASGAQLLMGSGRFIGPKTIEVELVDGGTRVLRGEKVIISTGSRSTVEPIPGLAEASPLTHIEALELDHIPAHLIIIGC